MFRMRPLERIAFIIAGVLLIVFTGLVTFQLVRPVAASAPAQTLVADVITVPPRVAAPAAEFPYPGRVFCPACAIDSLPIPIWRQSSATTLACWLGSGDPRSATVLAEERSIKGALMLQVQTARCTGWLPGTWVKRR
jgi:hypothetical protein